MGLFVGKEGSGRSFRSRLISSMLLVSMLAALSGCGKSEAKAAYAAGCEALKAGDLELARSEFGKTIEADAFLSEAYRGIGLIELGQTNYADASIAFEKSLLYVDGENENYIRDVNLYLAFSRERQGLADKALEIYDGLIKKSPDSDTLYLRGRLNLKNGNTKAAKADFEQAIELNADYDLYINIYELYNDEERSGDGARYLEAALTAANGNADDYYSQGLVNYYLQNYEDARDLLIKAVKKDASDGKAVFLLGKIYLAMNDLADASAIFKEHTNDENTAADAYNGLVLCDLSGGDYESALTHVEAGLANASGDAEQALLFNEIVVYEKQADWAKARSKAVSYVAKYPTDEAGVREYEFLVTR